MIKKGKIEVGKTPSIVSGKRSKRVDKDLNPLAKNEKIKLANSDNLKFVFPKKVW